MFLRKCILVATLPAARKTGKLMLLARIRKVDQTGNRSRQPGQKARANAERHAFSSRKDFHAKLPFNAKICKVRVSAHLFEPNEIEARFAGQR